MHLLLQSACHTLMPPNSTSPQHGYAHSSSRFQGPYKQKNQKYESVLTSWILIVTASFQTKPHLSSKVFLSDRTHEPPVKKGKMQPLPPEQSKTFVFHHAAHMYSIVPQKVCVTVPSWMDSLHNPKSVSFTWPEIKYIKFKTCQNSAICRSNIEKN